MYINSYYFAVFVNIILSLVCDTTYKKTKTNMVENQTLQNIIYLPHSDLWIAQTNISKGNMRKYIDLYKSVNLFSERVHQVYIQAQYIMDCI